MTTIESAIAALPEKSLLLLDDDGPLRNRLGRALESRGFQTTLVESVAEALTAVRSRPPAFAVLDMRLEDGSVLRLKPSVLAAIRIPGQYDPEGNPMYTLKTQVIMTIAEAREELKRGYVPKKAN